jgi:GTPase SAR1 family protein
MSRFGTLIMGPAGAGKTTFCNALLQHLNLTRRSAFHVNLDPAAETFAHTPDLDIRELISLEDAMSELGLGPNGGLMACFEYLLQNPEFLTDALETIPDDVLVVIDMPGQIELFTHTPLVPQLVRLLGGGGTNMRVCAVYLLEASFVVDKAKFFAGALSAMSAMLLVGLPHVNVLSKMDIVKGMVAKREVRRFLNMDATDLLADLEGPGMEFEEDENEKLKKEVVMDPTTHKNVLAGKSFRALNEAVARLIDEFGLVSFLQLESGNEDSVAAVLSYIDDAIQFHEAQEPKDPKEEDYGDMDEME